jgi:hypothetical protein
MPDDTIALIITIAIIALFFVWVPLLNLVCPPCGRFLEQRRSQKRLHRVTFSTTSPETLAE